MQSCNNLINEIIQEALVHKIDGNYVGAFVFKKNKNNEVQPITLHKDSISLYFDKLLDELPSTYKGKPAIGSIDKNYRSSKDVVPFNPIQESMTEAEAPIDNPVAKKYGQILSKPTTPKKLETLTNFFYKGSSHIDDLKDAFPQEINKFKKDFGVDDKGLKDLVSLAHSAKETSGADWTDKLAVELNSDIETTPFKRSEKAPEIPKALGTVSYNTDEGTHHTDLDYLAHATHSLMSVPLSDLHKNDPTLYNDLKNKLGSHWEDILELSKNAKVAGDLNKNDNAWASSLQTSKNPFLVDKIAPDDLSKILPAIYQSANLYRQDALKTAQPHHKDVHYHTQPDGKKVFFNSKDLNSVISDLGTEPPVSLIYKNPDQAMRLKEIFGKNWAVLISVAQRINKHKSRGIDDPVGMTKQEYGVSLKNLFGNDWEKNFDKISQNLDMSSQITQKDPSLIKKDKKLDSLNASYDINNKQFVPNLNYLKTIALPAISGKSSGYLLNLDTEDSKLSRDFENNLGPSWYHLLNIAKKAISNAAKGHDPYVNFAEEMDKNQTAQVLLKNKFGSAFDQVAFNVIHSITGIKPPKSIENLKTSEYTTQPETPTRNTAALPTENVPTNVNIPAQSNPAANAQTIPAELDTAKPDETPTHYNLPVFTPESPNQTVATGVPKAPVTPQTTVAAQTTQDTTTTQELPVQPDQAVTQELPVQPDQQKTQELPAQETPTVEIPTPKPIEGGGGVPQSKVSNIASTTTQNISTEPALSYISNGIPSKITDENVIGLFNINLTPEQLQDPVVDSMMSGIYGPSWKKIMNVTHSVKLAIDAGTDPEAHIKALTKNPLESKVKDLKKSYGDDWKTFLTQLVNKAASIYKNSKSE